MSAAPESPVLPADPPLRPLRPQLRLPAELLLKAQRIKAAVFDVDGVLTDGGLRYGADGEVLKVFNALDGHGLKLLRHAGIEPVIITGRDAPAVRRRIADLGIVHAWFGVGDKLEAGRRFLASSALAWHELAVMGDDWPDLALMLRAGFVCAPAQAHVEVKAVADHVTAARGGDGAARECCDLLLTAAGRYAELLCSGGGITLDHGAVARP